MSYKTTLSFLKHFQNSRGWGEFSKILKICPVPSFSTFWNKQIHHSKGLEERNRILESFSRFNRKFKISVIFGKITFFTKTKKWPLNLAPLIKSFQMMYLFVSKCWKWRNWTDFWKFRKFSLAPTILKIF